MNTEHTYDLNMLEYYNCRVLKVQGTQHPRFEQEQQRHEIENERHHRSQQCKWTIQTKRQLSNQQLDLDNTQQKQQGNLLAR